MRAESNGGDETASAEESAHGAEPNVDKTSGNVSENEVEVTGAVSAPPGREELDDLQERYLRLAAEYENFRKRTNRERSEMHDRSQGQLITRLLDVLDDLDRLSEFSPESATVDSLLEGVRLIDRKLMRALEVAGLEIVPVEGERFDPEHHEALMLTPTNDPAEDEMVGNVFQPGYRFKGILLRPARVQVKRLDA
jgi:molecular chaperone GrpE